MPSYQTNNKRLAKNTIMMYFRMIIMMVVSLYASRVILEVLGVTNYGIYNVVGGIVGLLGFVSGSMSLAVQRFFAYDLGRKDFPSLNKTFSMAIQVHLLISIIIFILAEILGYYLLPTLQIPIERMEAARWVFHLSIFTAIAKLIMVPFSALIISYERMGIFAYLSIIEAILSLVILFIIKWCVFSFDSLVFYAFLLFLITVMITLIYSFYCTRKIREVKYHIVSDSNIFKRLLGFASWTAFGEFAWCGTIQGVNIILNVFFDPVVNASRGIAYHVQSAVLRFVQNFQIAVNPQIIKYYANDEKEEMKMLTYRSTCFSFYLTLLLSLPLFLRMEYVLQLWLGQVPNYSIIFCQLILVNVLLDVISNLLLTVIKATGYIRNYYLIASILLLLNPILTFVALKLGADAEVSFYIYSTVSILLMIVRLLTVHNIAHIEVFSFIRNVIIPIITHIVIVFPIIYLLNSILYNNVISMLVLYGCTAIVTCMAIYFFDLSKSERFIIINKIKDIIIKRKNVQTYIK